VKNKILHEDFTPDVRQRDKTKKWEENLNVEKNLETGHVHHGCCWLCCERTEETKRMTAAKLFLCGLAIAVLVTHSTEAAANTEDQPQAPAVAESSTQTTPPDLIEIAETEAVDLQSETQDPIATTNEAAPHITLNEWAIPPAPGANVDRNSWPAEISFVTEQAVYRANAESITAILVNNATNDLFTLSGVIDYFLEKQVDGQWQRVPGSMWTQDLAMPTPAGHYQRLTVVNAQFHEGQRPANTLFVDGFAPGAYRIITNTAFWRQNDRFITGFVPIWQGTVAAEFVIEE